MKRLLMGNEAIAYGALRAGLAFAAGYPGTPSTEIIETIAKEARKQTAGGHSPETLPYIEWSVNEKAALEAAAGAAIAGARALVTMKQVGLNVASDPLMCLNYVGLKGALVAVVADDPGPVSSQTEQDTRRFGRYAHIAVFDPASPEEAYLMIARAFDVSAETGRPVIFRPTTRVCHSYATVLIPEPDAPGRSLPPGREPPRFTKDGGKWVIFPRLAYRNHLENNAIERRLSDRFSASGDNLLSGAGRKGIAAGGVSWSYVMDALRGQNAACKLLKIGAYPFPETLALDFLSGLEEVLVVEELDPVIERELIFLCGLKNIRVRVRGKLSGDMPAAGENTPALVAQAAALFLQDGPSPPAAPASAQAVPTEALELPLRPPVLCAGCPHRASFFAVKEALKGRQAVFCGDIGCYTLGNAPPLDMVDTCLCMGAGITMAQGIGRVDKSVLPLAFIGDSTFFHTGIQGIINGVFNGADIIVIVLDNGTTAMTGGQVHPGCGKTVTGTAAPRLSIAEIAAACKARSVRRVNAFDLNGAKQAVLAAADERGVRVLIFEGPCVTLARAGAACTVDRERCNGCALCVKKLGCPALSKGIPGAPCGQSAARIDTALCSGCTVCAQVCPQGAISGGGLC